MRKLAFAVVALAMSSGSAANARSYVTILPGKMSPTVQEQVSGFFGEEFQKLQPGDTLVVFDAEKLRRVATLQMPDVIPEGRRGRVKALGAAAGQIQDFVASSGTDQGDNNLNIPAVLREIGETVLPSFPDRQANVVLIGSVFFSNLRNAKFSNREYILSDGFLNEKGVFGVHGQEDVLKGALVSICSTDRPDSFLSEGFRQSTISFWGKSIVGRGGKVGSIEAYGPGCAARLMSNAVDPARYEIDTKQKEYLTKLHWMPVEVR